MLLFQAFSDLHSWKLLRTSSNWLKWLYMFVFSILGIKTESFKQCLLIHLKWKWKLLSHVQLFATPWTAAHQASLSITNSQSLLKFMSMELVMPSNHLILCHPLLLLPSVFPSIRGFSNKSVFASGGQIIGVSASASVLPMNIQDWFSLGGTCWISLQSKGLSRIFSNTTVQKHQFVGTQPYLWSNSHIRAWLLEKP